MANATTPFLGLHFLLLLPSTPKVHACGKSSIITLRRTINTPFAVLKRLADLFEKAILIDYPSYQAVIVIFISQVNSFTATLNNGPSSCERGTNITVNFTASFTVNSAVGRHDV
jgi:hypothetical protein